METVNWLIGNAVYTCEVEPGACPFCYAVGAVTELPPPILAVQPDDTTHVCNPALGGCNHGFSKAKQKKDRTRRIR